MKSSFQHATALQRAAASEPGEGDGGQSRANQHVKVVPCRTVSCLVNVGIALVSTAFCLASAEVTLRVLSYLDDVRPSQAFQSLSQTNTPKDFNKEVVLGEIIRLSANPRIIYELIPDISVIFKGALVTINAHGFRGPAFGVTKGERALRIVGLGDSVMFGQGVGDDETYLALLSQVLNKSAPAGYRWEIINTAVSGYNTVMEVATFRDKGLRYTPDLVIIGYIVATNLLVH